MKKAILHSVTKILLSLIDQSIVFIDDFMNYKNSHCNYKTESKSGGNFSALKLPVSTPNPTYATDTSHTHLTTHSAATILTFSAVTVIFEISQSGLMLSFLFSFNLLLFFLL